PVQQAGNHRIEERQVVAGPQFLIPEIELVASIWRRHPASENGWWRNGTWFTILGRTKEQLDDCGAGRQSHANLHGEGPAAELALNAWISVARIGELRGIDDLSFPQHETE